MASYNRNGWLDMAMAQVRSKPEHKAIRAELQGHLEDKEQYFLEKGMQPREAAKAAVEAMGDPVTVGKELDKAHPVRWARLYTVCKTVIVLLVLVLIFFLMDGMTKDRWEGWWVHYPLQTAAPTIAENAVVLDGDYATVREKGYTVRITDVHWRPTAVIQADTGLMRAENVLQIFVKVSNLWPWADPPLFTSQFQIKGDQNTALNRLYCRMPSSYYNWAIGDDWEGVLSDRKSWNAYYIVVEVTGADPGEEVILYVPGNSEVKWTIPVEVVQ